MFRGTPVRFWLESELVEIFGIDQMPSAETADDIYDAIAAKLATPEFRPRALYDRFGIEFLATTDDPCDDLAAHAKLASDPTWTGQVAPTFRPDKYLEPAQADWNQAIDRLGEVSGVDTGTFAGWVGAMENRRGFFKQHGAVSTDHSHADARVEPITDAEAERLYALARSGRITPDEADTLRRNFMFAQARMAADDGLVMTLHPAVYRNHHTPTFEAYGADVGCDIPMAVEFTKALQPMLEAFGTSPFFQLVVFTMDETVYSRELAPLAGFYPSVYVGVPWWFVDAPEAMARFRGAVTESAGFTRTSGFIDDTRAYLSIPARHDLSRRVDSGYLAKLVGGASAEHRRSPRNRERARGRQPAPGVQALTPAASACCLDALRTRNPTTTRTMPQMIASTPIHRLIDNAATPGKLTINTPAASHNSPPSTSSQRDVSR